MADRLRTEVESGYHRPRMSRRATALHAAFVGLLTAAGCRGCHDDHPYVPYAIGSGAPSTEAPEDAAPPAAASAAPVEAGADLFAGEPAVVAPPGLSVWALDGATLSAPDGMVFVLGIVRDFDGDGTKDAFAVVRPPDGNDPGRLVYYRSGATTPPVAFDPPPGLARDPTCTAVDRLEAVGETSLLVELGEQCPMHPSSAPVRWVAVLSAGASPRVRLAATLADPAGAPALSIDADASDRDADGREDIALRVTIEGGGAPLEPGPRVSATLAWLDRPAGLSRDAGATEASFASLASAASHAARSKDAPTVPNYVRQVRALWRATCAEGGAPRIVGVVGAGAIGCGAGRALESLGLDAVRAYATMDDPLRAALALDRAERAPATRTPARAAEAQAWVTKLAPLTPARALRAVAAVPLEPKGHEPAWGALAFEPGGKLLVRTAAGVVRVDPDQGDEDAAGGVDWKPAVTSPDASIRWIEAYDPCDGLPLRATFATGGGDDVRDVALPVPPSLAGRCAGSRGAPANAVPIAWGPRGLEAIVEGEPVLIAPDLSSASALAGFLDQTSSRGSPRSPDGKTLVVPTESGLLVRGPTRSRLLRARELDGTYPDQRACAVSDDATHVACIRNGKAWVGAWEAP
jgi:hypothetical protein